MGQNQHGLKISVNTAVVHQYMQFSVVFFITSVTNFFKPLTKQRPCHSRLFIAVIILTQFFCTLLLETPWWRDDSDGKMRKLVRTICITPWKESKSALLCFPSFRETRCDPAIWCHLIEQVRLVKILNMLGLGLFNFSVSFGRPLIITSLFKLSISPCRLQQRKFHYFLWRSATNPPKKTG